MNDEYFYIHDNVHGEIKLPILIKYIIDTPQFQRLRKIKQLGLCSNVFINATHTRFEHCIGTAFLTQEFIRILKINFSHLINKQEELCLIIAGLCHDLGHGPFSHFFENIFHNNFTHEKMSLIMFDNLINLNKNVQIQLSNNGLNISHINLIKAMITGDQSNIEIPTFEIDSVLYKKYFLFEIVCNNQHGIDTDKMDYLKRDSYMLQLQCSFDYHRIINNVIIVKFEQSLILSFNHKLLLDCNEIFHSRWKMQKNVYRHKTVIAIELMMEKVILGCREILDIKNICSDPLKFLDFTDEFLYLIKFSDFTNKKTVLKILNDIDTRRIFKHGGRFLIPFNFIKDVKDNLEPLKKNVECFIEEKFGSIQMEVYLSVTEFGFQKGSCINPLEKIYFFKKHDMNPFRVDMSTDAPLITKFGSELFLDVYYNFLNDDSDLCKTAEEVENAIGEWWKINPLSIN